MKTYGWWVSVVKVASCQPLLCLYQLAWYVHLKYTRFFFFRSVSIHSRIAIMSFVLFLQAFMEHVQQFVEQLDSVAHINLFLTELKLVPYTHSLVVKWLLETASIIYIGLSLVGLWWRGLWWGGVRGKWPV